VPIRANNLNSARIPRGRCREIGSRGAYVSRIVGLLSAVSIACVACFGTPGTTVTSATTAVYAAGATRDTISAQLPRSPAKVFDAILRQIEEAPDAEVSHLNSQARMVEVAWSGRTMTAQATELGPQETLLFLWVDAGDTGLTAKEVGTHALKELCLDLNVEYELVEY